MNLLTKESLNAQVNEHKRNLTALKSQVFLYQLDMQEELALPRSLRNLIDIKNQIESKLPN